ncbi:ATPase family associated with various cellular activities (AAA) domain-containing protein [Ditylenchus destructor]|uniref:microtubule-severing ATPase n=1 Tax=Ditylenchus destructor TaxID=166010 RepID=A0AAD4MUU8_9BILA|nr:ATPase family associated with various cellular activities (AAA) domain-containing protein [Ditylenchus destructor]
MSKPQQVLKIDPPHELIFEGFPNFEFIPIGPLNNYPFKWTHVKPLRLSNPTTQAVFFEVTQFQPPDKLYYYYYIRPQTGLVEPGHTVEINISAQVLYPLTERDFCTDEPAARTWYKTDQSTSKNGFLNITYGTDIVLCRCSDFLHKLYGTDKSTSALDFLNELLKETSHMVDKSQIMESILTVNFLRKKMSTEMRQKFISSAATASEEAQTAIVLSQQLVEVLRENQEKKSTYAIAEAFSVLDNETERLQRLAHSLKYKEARFNECMEHFEKGEFPLYENEATQIIEKIQGDTLNLHQLRKYLVELMDFLNIFDTHKLQAQTAICQSQQLVEVLREKQKIHLANGDTETATALGNEIEVLQGLVDALKEKEGFKKCMEHFKKEDFLLFDNEVTQAIEKLQKNTLNLLQRLKSLEEKLKTLNVIDAHKLQAQTPIVKTGQLVEVLREKQEKHSRNGDAKTDTALANEIEVLQGLAHTLKQNEGLKKCMEHFEKEDFLPFKNEATQVIKKFQEDTLKLDHRLKSTKEKLKTLSVIEKIQNGKQTFLRSVDTALAEEILETIVKPTNPFTVGQGSGVKLADIEGNDKAKTALQQSVIFPMINPRLFSGLRAPSKGLLFYGPPGNGKTMIAKAAAEEAKCTFFSISAATIMAKCYTWEGEKMVKTLFQMARNAQPSIIFIDEIDSMLCGRTGNESGAERRVKTEFLVQMDGCTNKADDKLLVLGTTNRPHELDEAVLRRLPQRIFIDLPNAVARRSLIVSTFEQHKTAYQITDGELVEIANMTDGYSYSDLLAVCSAAANEPLKEIDKSKLAEITPDMLRPVNYRDFITAIRNTRPTTSPENRRKLQEFASAGTVGEDYR